MKEKMFLFLFGKPYSGRKFFTRLLKEKGLDLAVIDLEKNDIGEIGQVLKDNQDKQLFVVIGFPETIEDFHKAQKMSQFDGQWVGIWIDRTDTFCISNATKDTNMSLIEIQNHVIPKIEQFDYVVEEVMHLFCINKNKKNLFFRTSVDCELSREMPGPSGIWFRFGLGRFQKHPIWTESDPFNTERREMVGVSHEG